MASSYDLVVGLRELVDWIIDGQVRDDFRQLSYDRISNATPFDQSFGGNRA